VINFRTCVRRNAFIVAACFAMTMLASSPSEAAAKIQHLISPGGIEAWFVQDATVPLVAMEYSFGGGATQDPADKSGVGNMVANLLDEGSGDLDSKTFHERLDRRAIELSFSSTRDYFRGSLRMLKDNTDEAFDLLRMALTSPHFESADVERVRAQILSGLRRDTFPACVATLPIRRRWPAASSWKSPLATIPMAGRPTVPWKACRRSMSPT
jgi:zinc protease